MSWSTYDRIVTLTVQLTGIFKEGQYFHQFHWKKYRDAVECL